MIQDSKEKTIIVSSRHENFRINQKIRQWGQRNFTIDFCVNMNLVLKKSSFHQSWKCPQLLRILCKPREREMPQSWIDEEEEEICWWT